MAFTAESFVDSVTVKQDVVASAGWCTKLRDNYDALLQPVHNVPDSAINQKLDDGKTEIYNASRDCKKALDKSPNSMQLAESVGEAQRGAVLLRQVLADAQAASSH